MGAWLLTQVAACACTLMAGGGVVKANACHIQGATVPPAMQSPSELWQLATLHVWLEQGRVLLPTKR